MDPRGFHTITLGCKLNQFDTAGIAGELVRRGYREQAVAADAAGGAARIDDIAQHCEHDPRRLRIEDYLALRL